MPDRLARIENWAELAQLSNYSVKALAKHCRVSVRQLERHFKKRMKISPHQWLVRQRQEKAVKLLEAGAMVKEVAFAVGYKSAAHFSREFKQVRGHPPSQIFQSS